VIAAIYAEEDLMDEGADELIVRFAGAANKTMLHPVDWGRFHEFIVHVHTFGIRIAEVEVRDRLKQLGFTHEASTRLASFYLEARSLLTVYDKQRGQANERRP